MLSKEFVVRADVVSQHDRAKCPAQTRHLLADVTAADDADNSGRELSAAGLPPLEMSKVHGKRHD
jgi:hypothetical protein